MPPVAPHPNPITGFVRLRRDCSADFVQNAVTCSDPRPKSADLRLVFDGANQLVPMIGISPLGRTSPLEKTPLRLGGLGRGDDFWVRTTGGKLAHVFVTTDIEPDSTEIELWHVTR